MSFEPQRSGNRFSSYQDAELRRCRLTMTDARPMARKARAIPANCRVCEPVAGRPPAPADSHARYPFRSNTPPTVKSAALHAADAPDGDSTITKSTVSARPRAPTAPTTLFFEFEMRSTVLPPMTYGPACAGTLQVSTALGCSSELGLRTPSPGPADHQDDDNHARGDLGSERRSGTHIPHVPFAGRDP